MGMRMESNVMKDEICTQFVVGICGSLRECSYSRVALREALLGAKEEGVSTVLIDPRDYSLPFCTGEELHSQALEHLKQQLHSSTAIIIASPEYHGSYSGVLKNLLDLLTYKEFEGRLCGLIGVSEGINGGLNALIHLREVLRSLKAWVIPMQVSISQASTHFNPTGALTNQALRQRLLRLSKELIRYSPLIQHTHKHP